MQPQSLPLTLEYRAMVAGAPVGEATVTVTVGLDGTYRVHGRAWSNGWLKGFSAWRNRFGASGQVIDGDVLPKEFRYHEQDRDKDRRVVVRRNQVQVTKNGRRRPVRPATGDPDPLSVLLVAPSCAGDQRLHTGRHGYRLERLAGTERRCRFRVSDDDDDAFELELELDHRAGRLVPSRITVFGWMTGWIELAAVRRGDSPGGAR